MNEHEEPKLITRRARRMQEQLETTGIPVVSDFAAQSADSPPADAAVQLVGADAIEISRVDEDGRPRTRREMRELREAALANGDKIGAPEPQVAADDEVETVPVAPEAPVVPEEPEVAVAVAVDADSEAQVEAPAEEFVVADDETEDFDARLAQTEAMSFGDLIEVAMDAVPAEPETAEAEPAEPETAEAGLDAEANVESDVVADAGFDAAAAAPAKGRFRLPWGRSKDASAEAEAETETKVDVDVDVDELEALELDERSAEDDARLAEDTISGAGISDEGDEAIVEIDGDEDVEPAVHPVEEQEQEQIEEPVVPAPIDDEDEEEEDGEVADAPAPASARTSYSFPDIAPLAEERSVFDDPATQAIAALPSDELVAPLVERTGDFDDLISRAIAAEGATSTNTAALILPSMPEGTDLAGPLGETGELFVTGSIELPKSLGETGGHSRLHDLVESDPLEDLGIDLSDEPVPDNSAPVSATRAISARMVEGSGVVAPHTKKGNRLPLILSLTAGGLLLAVIGLLAWGGSNGMFG